MIRMKVFISSQYELDEDDIINIKYIFEHSNSVRSDLIKLFKEDKWFVDVKPPFFNRITMLRTHWFCFGKMLISIRHIQTIKPHIFCSGLIIKKQNISSNGCIRSKYAMWQSNNCM